MKTVLIAAAATALLLFLVSIDGQQAWLQGARGGYASLCVFMAIYLVGRTLAHRRANAARTREDETPGQLPTTESTLSRELPQEPTVLASPPVPDHEAWVDIGGRQYLIEADPAYLAHIRPVFEPRMAKVFHLLASGARTVVDVGANVGCTALLYSRIAKRVHAFEPSRETFGQLERNVGRAGEAGNLTLHQMALGSSCDTLELVASPYFRAGSFIGSLSEVSVGHVAEQVEVRTLDVVAAELRIEEIDFIKIDTEGFDGEVVRGAMAVLRSNSPIVVMELNHWCLNVSRRTSVPDYLDHLRSVFPVLFALSDDGETYLDLHNKDHRYNVMYRHILHGDYVNLLGAFDLTRLSAFLAEFRCDYWRAAQE